MMEERYGLKNIRSLKDKFLYCIMRCDKQHSGQIVLFSSFFLFNNYVIQLDFLQFFFTFEFLDVAMAVAVAIDVARRYQHHFQSMMIKHFVIPTRIRRKRFFLQIGARVNILSDFQSAFVAISCLPDAHLFVVLRVENY